MEELKEFLYFFLKERLETIKRIIAYNADWSLIESIFLGTIMFVVALGCYWVVVWITKNDIIEIGYPKVKSKTMEKQEKNIHCLNEFF